MSEITQLGDLQLAIMRELWRTGEATVAEVHQGLLGSRGLAPTTIATMLKKMEARGLVRHRSEGRRFIYEPTVSEDNVTRSMVADLMNRLFAGRPSRMVSHLISEHELDERELTELTRLIAAAEEAGELGDDGATGKTDVTTDRTKRGKR